jgi:hypothetical protein
MFLPANDSQHGASSISESLLNNWAVSPPPVMPLKRVPRLAPPQSAVGGRDIGGSAKRATILMVVRFKLYHYRNA